MRAKRPYQTPVLTTLDASPGTPLGDALRSLWPATFNAPEGEQADAQASANDSAAPALQPAGM